MNRNNKQVIDDAMVRPNRQSGALRKRLSNCGILLVFVHLGMIGLILLISGGQKLSAEQLSSDKFRRIVQAELAGSQANTDSVGTVLNVMVLGGTVQDFMLAPVIRNGKVVAVYKDDPKRNGVIRLANEAVLKSIKLDLFSHLGAGQAFRESGYASCDPVAVSVGPCSLFGVLETGWYLPVKDSFVLLSLEGRIATESEVARFWTGKLAAFRQIGERLLPKE